MINMMKKTKDMNYNLSRMQKGSLFAEAMVIVYCIKKHFYTILNSASQPYEVTQY